MFVFMVYLMISTLRLPVWLYVVASHVYHYTTVVILYKGCKVVCYANNSSLAIKY